MNRPIVKLDSWRILSVYGCGFYTIILIELYGTLYSYIGTQNLLKIELLSKTHIQRQIMFLALIIKFYSGTIRSNF